MNQTVEKFLMIGALVGWVASLGSLVGLATRAAAPAVASHQVQAANSSSVSRNSLIVQRSNPRFNQSSPDLLTIQRESAVTTIPVDTSGGYWVNSLKEESSKSAKWVSQRSR